MRTRQAKRRQQAPRRALRSTLFVLAAGAGLGLGLHAGDAVLRAVAAQPRQVRHVSVTGQRHVATAELLARANITYGAHFSELDREALLRHPWIRDARMVLLPTGRLLLSVEERRPRAVAVLERGRHWVDAEGVAFAVAPAPSATTEATARAPLPELLGVAAMSQADALIPNPLFAQGIGLLDAARALGLPTPEAVQLGGGPARELPALRFRRDAPGGSLTALLGAENPGARLLRLARVWRSGLPAFEQARVVDLRFGEQLILRGGGLLLKPLRERNSDDFHEATTIASLASQAKE